MEENDVLFWQENKEYLDLLAPEPRAQILDDIAEHYGITPEQAYDEVTSPNAYCLLEYMVEPIRSATLMHMLLVGKAPKAYRPSLH